MLSFVLLFILIIGFISVIYLLIKTSKFLIDKFYERLGSRLYQDMVKDGTCSK